MIADTRPTAPFRIVPAAFAAATDRSMDHATDRATNRAADRRSAAAASIAIPIEPGRSAAPGGTAPTPARADTVTGFELGWDHARHGVEPPAPWAQAASPLRDGLLAGRATHGARTLAATPPVRRWLQLRLDAWLRGVQVEPLRVTPNFLRQIEVAHCPISRAPLHGGGSNVRVRHTAGYAAGNLAMVGTAAQRAKGALDHRAALQLARQQSAMASNAAPADTLTPAGWRRLAVLCSFVETLPHDEVRRLPMHLLPPNRLQLFNPVQALQALLCRQVLAPGWSARLRVLESMMPGAAARHALLTFFHALLPRVLETLRRGDALHSRWAVEDAWDDERVCQRWSELTGLLSAAQCEAIVVDAARRRLGPTLIESSTLVRATEGWNLDHGGRAAPQPVRRNVLRRAGPRGVPPAAGTRRDDPAAASADNRGNGDGDDDALPLWRIARATDARDAAS